MKSQFRAKTPRDAHAVTAFLQRVFDMEAGHPMVAAPQLHWECWESRSDWPESRGYAIFHDDEILAHGTVVPLSCTSRGGKLRPGATAFERTTERMDDLPKYPAAPMALVGVDKDGAPGGFHARDGLPLRLLACGDSALPETPLRFQMIDSDAAYLHRDQNDSWGIGISSSDSC